MKENLSLFLQLAKSDKEEAKRIFFGKTFKEYYLQDEHKLQAEYDLLMNGQEQNQILDEFLVCAGASEPKTFEMGDILEEKREASGGKDLGSPCSEKCERKSHG